MAATLKLEIVTPAGTVYAEDVEMVTLPGVAGQMGIYPRHVPLMTQLVPGEMIVRKEGRDLFIATGEGLIEVTARRGTGGAPSPARSCCPPRASARHLERAELPWASTAACSRRSRAT